MLVELLVSDFVYFFGWIVVLFVFFLVVGVVEVWSRRRWR